MSDKPVYRAEYDCDLTDAEYAFANGDKAMFGKSFVLVRNGVGTRISPSHVDVDDDVITIPVTIYDALTKDKATDKFPEPPMPMVDVAHFVQLIEAGLSVEEATRVSQVGEVE